MFHHDERHEQMQRQSVDYSNQSGAQRSRSINAERLLGGGSNSTRANSIRGGDGFMNSEIVSLQIATLQERTDKVYAMLTTKLGRVW